MSLRLGGLNVNHRNQVISPLSEVLTPISDNELLVLTLVLTPTELLVWTLVSTPLE